MITTRSRFCIIPQRYKTRKSWLASISAAAPCRPGAVHEVFNDGDLRVPLFDAKRRAKAGSVIRLLMTLATSTRALSRTINEQGGRQCRCSNVVMSTYQAGSVEWTNRDGILGKYRVGISSIAKMASTNPVAKTTSCLKSESHGLSCIDDIVSRYAFRFRSACTGQVLSHVQAG